jgi:hypothetical protein
MIVPAPQRQSRDVTGGEAVASQERADRRLGAPSRHGVRVAATVQIIQLFADRRVANTLELVRMSTPTSVVHVERADPAN